MKSGLHAWIFLAAVTALAACSATPQAKPDEPAVPGVITISELASRAAELHGRRVAVEGYLDYTSVELSVAGAYLTIHDAERIEIAPGEFNVRCAALPEPNYRLVAPDRVVRSGREIEGRRVVISGVLRNEAWLGLQSPFSFDFAGWFEDVRIEKIFADSCRKG